MFLPGLIVVFEDGSSAEALEVRVVFEDEVNIKGVVVGHVGDSSGLFEGLFLEFLDLSVLVEDDAV